MSEDGTIFPPRPTGDEAPPLDRGPGRPLSQVETGLSGPGAPPPPEQPAGPNASPLSAFAFSPDGRVLATASGREARLWWVETRRPLRPPLSSPSDIVALCFSHDGKTLLSAGADRVIRSRRLPDVDPARLEALTGMRLQDGGLTALTAPVGRAAGQAGPLTRPPVL